MKSQGWVSMIYEREIGEMRVICLQGIGGTEGGKHRRRSSVVSHKLQLADYAGVGGGQEDTVTNGTVIEVKS